MKHRYLIINLFFLFLLWGINIQSAQANHAMAVDLNYFCIDGQTYEVRLSFYYDCGSTEILTAPDAPVVNLLSISCGINQDIVLEQIPLDFGQEVSQLCEEILSNNGSNCQGGDQPGVREYRYRGTVELTEQCEDYLFSYQLPDQEFRSAGITNLLSSELLSMHVEAKLNNTLGCNNSPAFNTIPVSYYCTQGNFFYPGTVEIDGDSIVYTLVAPKSAAGVAVLYEQGFVAENPLVAGIFDFDSVTGFIEFQADQQQKAAVGLLVEEYRDGELIGSVIRDMQFIVLDCTNRPPLIQHTVINDPSSFNELRTDYYTFCAGTTFTWDTQVRDFDPMDSVSVVADLSLFNGASLEITDKVNNQDVTYRFEWTPDITHVGLHVLALRINDNACEISAIAEKIVYLEVIGAPDVGPDVGFCEGGLPLVLEVSGGYDFTWTPTTGLSSQNANNSIVLIEPVAGMSEMTYTVSNECGETDVLTVSNVENFELDLADVRVCRGDGVELMADAGAGTFSYNWSPTIGLSDPTIANPIASPNNTTTYTVTVTSDDGCSISASNQVEVVNDLRGQVVIDPAEDVDICQGESVTLNANFELTFSFFCGLADDPSETCNTELTKFTPVNGVPETSFKESPYNMSKPFNRVQYLFRADELQIIPGKITSLSFDIIRQLSTEDYQNYSIKMGCTDVNVLDDYVQGLQEVFFRASLPVNIGANIHVLDTPYEWDSSSNLVIEICNTPTEADFFDEIAVADVGYNATLVGNSSNTSFTSGCVVTLKEASQLRPITTFTYCFPDFSNIPPAVWSPAEGLSTTQGPTTIAAPTTTTTYTVQFGDAVCIAPQSITVNVADRGIEVRSDTTICEAQAVQLFINGDIPTDATVEWSPNTGLSNPNARTTLADITEDITYAVTVNFNDGLACSTITDSVSINVGIATPLSLSSETICGGEIHTFDLQGADGYSISWENGKGLSCLDCPNPTVTASITDDYSVTITNGGCQEVLSSTLTVVPNPTLEPLSDIRVRSGTAVVLEASGNYEELTWRDQLGNVLDGVAPEVMPSSTTTYIAEAVNGDFCRVEETLQVIITSCEGLKMPTAFSPNGDGLNDLFLPAIADYDSLTIFQVYNRWGEMVYEHDLMGQLAGWDGQYEQVAAPVGSYVYHIRAVCEDRVIEERGHVLLVR